MEFLKLLFTKYQNSKYLKNSTKHLPISSPINVSKRDFRQFNKGKPIQYISEYHSKLPELSWFFSNSERTEDSENPK